MKKRLVLSICSCIVVFAVCIALVLIYKAIAFGGLGIALNSMQAAALPILAVILGAVINLRFILPLFDEKKENDELEETEKPQSSVLCKCTDFAAWLSLGLALAALVASPLASTADYIGYAALFGVIFAVLALFPVVSKTEAFAEAATNRKLVVGTAIAALLLSVIPAVGVYASLCGIIFSVVALRECILAKNKGTVTLLLGIFSLLLSVVLSLLFIMFLL